MKRTARKLTLNAETVATLSPLALHAVRGAQAVETWMIECYTVECGYTEFEEGCAPTMQDTCYSVNMQCTSAFC